LHNRHQIDECTGYQNIGEIIDRKKALPPDGEKDYHREQEKI
jgi:hypothetical protein